MQKDTSELSRDAAHAFESAAQSGHANGVGFDDNACTPELLSVKAAIPYLEPRHRRAVAIIIKLCELKRLMEYYEHTAVSTAAHRPKDWRRGMLSAFCAHMPAERRKHLDMVMSAVNAMDMMNAAHPQTEEDML